MNTKPRLVITLAAVLGFNLQAPAQEPAETPPAPPPSIREPGGLRPLGRVEKITDLLGREVRSPKDDQLAKVHDVALDLENGRIALLVLSAQAAGKESLVALPPGCLRQTNDALVLDTDRVSLDSIPRFGRDKLGDLCQTNEIARLCRQLGEEPYFSPRYETNYTYTQGTTNRAHIALKNLLDKKVGDVEQVAVAYVYYVEEPCVITNTEVKAIPDTAIRVADVSTAARLLGVAVKIGETEAIGYVENILVDFASGRVVALIVSSGEFLGLPGEMSPIPSAAFQPRPSQGVLQLNISKSGLAEAPHFNPGSWPDFQGAYAERVHRAYGIEPFFGVTSLTRVGQ
jgi:sporulation protein YlmC with PRC-barrel domain